MLHRIVIIIILLGAFTSCEKYKDNPGQDDPRLDRPFCNDPEAVNYNWDFPGKPDNSVCFYPTDMLAGSYTLQDSIYSSENILDTLGIRTVYFNIHPLSRSHIGVVGLCGPDTLFFLSDRHYNVSADSLFDEGQAFCSPLDTMTGTMRLTPGDTTFLKLDLTVNGGVLTGVRYHRGTAIKQ